MTNARDPAQEDAAALNAAILTISPALQATT